MNRREESLLRFLCAQRMVKFAVVGALGIVVQLTALEMLIAFGFHYLWATGLAVEAAVLHNFMWHQRFTWSDRRRQTGMQLVRFHVSNGAISIFGTLVLMRFLVGQFGVGVVFANLLTIGTCALGNFLASDRWVFLSPLQSPFTQNRQSANGLPSEAMCAARKERI